jgi:phosphatidate cytidylyltransferase
MITTSNIFLRVISSLILIPFVIGIILIGGWSFGTLLAFAFAVSCAEWFHLSRETNRPYFYLILGLIYFSISFFEFSYLRLFVENGTYLTLVCMIMIWSSDTGAYFFGKKIGGALMSPNISPKKTWAGMIGAMIGASFSFTFLLYLAPYIKNIIPNTLELSVSQLSIIIIFSIVMGYVGQIGDLLISSMKRRAHVKDSSHLIPGHGGILDRIDSLLLVVPLFVIVARYVLH